MRNRLLSPALGRGSLVTRPARRPVAMRTAAQSNHRLVDTAPAAPRRHSRLSLQTAAQARGPPQAIRLGLRDASPGLTRPPLAPAVDSAQASRQWGRPVERPQATTHPLFRERKRSTDRLHPSPRSTWHCSRTNGWLSIAVSSIAAASRDPESPSRPPAFP